MSERYFYMVRKFRSNLPTLTTTKVASQLLLPQEFERVHIRNNEKPEYGTLVEKN